MPGSVPSISLEFAPRRERGGAVSTESIAEYALGAAPRRYRIISRGTKRLRGRRKEIKSVTLPSAPSTLSFGDQTNPNHPSTMLPPFISRSYAYVQESVSSKLQNATIAVLASGPIPKHVAFVMDGNRRFARKAHKEIAQGHAEGFVALRRVLEICMNLGVECVSVYAFAIENFKRTPQEVDALMTLAEEKLKEMSQHGDLLDQYGIRLNVLGRKDLLPARVQEAVRKAEEMTAKNNKAVLNLCMPYASRDDITTAIELSVEKAVEDHDFEISEEDVDAFISTSAVGSPPIDIWVRTSGVRRLSDYMTWQACEGTQIQFSDKYWPSFSLWDFIPILLDYQRKVWSSAA